MIGNSSNNILNLNKVVPNPTQIGQGKKNIHHQHVAIVVEVRPPHAQNGGHKIGQPAIGNFVRNQQCAANGQIGYGFFEPIELF